MRCFVGDCLERGVHRHHAVYAQECKRRWDGYPAVRERWPTWKALNDDPRNRLWVCGDHHGGHHQPGVHDDRRIALTDLPDETLEFAAELLGPYAFDYLGRRYRGDDPRLESLLATAT